MFTLLIPNRSVTSSLTAHEGNLPCTMYRKHKIKQQRRLPYVPRRWKRPAEHCQSAAAFAFPSIQGEASDSWKPFTCQFGMSLRKLYQAQRIASCCRRFWCLGEDSPGWRLRLPAMRPSPPGPGTPRAAPSGRAAGAAAGRGQRGAERGGPSARPASARPPPPPVPTPPPRVPGRAAVPLAPGAGGWSGGGAGRGASRWRWRTGCARAR